MKNKRIISFTIAAFSLICSIISMPKTAYAADNSIKIAVISDCHYMSPELNPFGKAFEKYIANDRKLLAQSNAIVKETVAEIKKSDADIVLVTGDITKDGEEIDHKRMASFFSDLEKSGKKVFVINGNHDIYNNDAVKFIGDKTQKVKNISPTEFKKIYADFGYNQAIAKDPNSMSYVVEPVKGFRIIAMDSCYYLKNPSLKAPITSGGFSNQRLNWIEKQIKDAKSKGKTIIGMMHHGIIPHFTYEDKFCPEYIISDHKNIANQFADLGLHVVFTGHFHAQDVAQQKSNKNNLIYDVETGSLVTYPCPYRIVSIAKDNKMNIVTKNVNKIDCNLDGKTLKQYSKNFVTSGLKELAPKLLKGFLIQNGKSETDANKQVSLLTTQQIFPNTTILDIGVNSIVNHYAGDEKMTTQTDSLINFLRSLNKPSMKMAADILYSLNTDLPPADNNLTIRIK